MNLTVVTSKSLLIASITDFAIHLLWGHMQDVEGLSVTIMQVISNALKVLIPVKRRGTIAELVTEHMM